MHRLLPLAFIAALSPAFGQEANLVGLEVRTTERDRVVGEVVAVRDGRAIIQLEAHDQPVAIELGRLQRDGNKLTLPLTEDELAQIPPVETAPPQAEGAPDQLPMGGSTPGWGAPQGGWTGPEYR